MARPADRQYDVGVDRRACLAAGWVKVACALTLFDVAGCSGSISGEPLDAKASTKKTKPTPGDPNGGSGNGAALPSTAASAADGGTPPARSGQELFTGLCAPCHGADGEGTTLGYELRHPDREHARWVIRNGRPGAEFENSEMIPFAEAVLSDADLDAIFDYLDSFPQPESGEELYLDYCRNCHGADAAGGTVDKSIRGRSYHDALEKVREGEGGKNYGARNQYMSAFDSSELSNAEVGAIADYLATL